MSLTYLQFLETVKTWFNTTTLSGITVCQFSQISLEDEIELNPDSKYPGLFVTPMPFSLKNEGISMYSCRVYLVNIIDLDKYNRITQINYMNEWLQKTIQEVPDNFNGIQWPIQVTPLVMWDLNGDGLSFDITITNQNPCYL